MTGMDESSLLEGRDAVAGPDVYTSLARKLASRGDLRRAASALDRAHGLDPTNAETRSFRADLLRRLSIEIRGILFRYVPAGWFLMRCTRGDPDELPVHPVWTDEYWLSETTISWSKYREVMDERAEPRPGREPMGETHDLHFLRYNQAKICRRYCRAALVPGVEWYVGGLIGEWVKDGKVISPEEAFGPSYAGDPERFIRYDTKPAVAVPWDDATEFCARLSTGDEVCRLPTEAEWEKGARGGLVGARYPWGNDLPTETTCDFGHFGKFFIRPFKSFAPNGYGLYAMSGSVWEWTADTYDALGYRENRPPAPSEAAQEKVLRGGSWADCAEAVTVSFRMSLAGHSRKCVAPNLGFRACLSRPSRAAGVD
jgi:formylglycine-generating enzyme required for sulfatase activity